MSNNKKTQVGYVKPSRTDIVRSVATSTAVETGQPSARVKLRWKPHAKSSPIFALPNPLLMPY